MSVLNLTTIANNCFSITAEGTTRTASFGGESLENSITNDPSADLNGPGLGGA